MENEFKEAALSFLEGLLDSGKVESKSKKEIEELYEKIQKSNISEELQHSIFKTIEILKKEYFDFGFTAYKNFKE
ncbi:hypothetical protein [Fusobacterium vincentii ATCC 49256]|jgi:putative uncharacterized protein FNV2244|uniref:Uncharacterized protein n=1 Tax=Fusobacterium vincentii ATCC 49256 TaxID=209882 RepID=Q7P8E6_FUSVC|nr:hypothetical protein RN95_10270 [Fusobacterium nucleatum subsp. nucleatum]EAA25209.1 hypothetical protein [Fusobacterium vincentii ATCC 49256]DAQ12364.1 MAG TPA: hypothetical protein [Caudoviricetes sp.]